MATILRSRVIRPSSRAESSKSYKVDTSKILSTDTLEVEITHESDPTFRKVYTFSGSEVAGKSSISFRVSDFGNSIDISWSVRTGLKSTSSKVEKPTTFKTPIGSNSGGRGNSDEHYILNLCDEILGEGSSRQHTFDFLKGDSGRKLQVDAFYPKKNLVIEYCEKQHTESVKLFDNKMTSSGIPRNEQRKKYDDLRQSLIPKNGIQFLSIDYSEFNHTSNKKLTRVVEDDKAVLQRILKPFLS